MTRMTLSLLTITMTTLLLVASVSGQDHKVMSAAEIDASLNQPCNFEYREMQFREVALDLEKAIGASVVLDRSAMDDSLTNDEPITCELKHVHLRTAMNVILDKYNATYLISENVVRIISKDVAGDPEFHRRRVFDCRPLLEQIASNEAGSPMNSSWPTGQAGSSTCLPVRIPLKRTKAILTSRLTNSF